MVETPVLFITFVRPDYARQTWEGIKAAKPKTLYFYSNKGRLEKDGEIERNNIIRSYVKEIDWDCDLHTWFRDECVNVYDSLRGAIDWLFDNEEQGIILEEDVVPSLAFFSFCDQMIEYYRQDRRVWYVSGDNLFNLNPQGYDYTFTHYHWMFGWATWRDRWKAVDWNNTLIDEMIEQDIYKHFFKTKRQCEERLEEKIRIKSFLEETKCWDYYFGMVCDQQNAVGVVPKRHLITNVGLTGEHHGVAKKTYVNNDCSYSDPIYRIEKRPPFVFVDYEYDYLDWHTEKQQVPIKLRIKRAISKIVRRYFPKP